MILYYNKIYLAKISGVELFRNKGDMLLPFLDMYFDTVCTHNLAAHNDHTNMLAHVQNC